ncbi:hypothetical protein N7495_000601 [Penicillium taxi]|uniref:uncharacterized protein n=1 Tax=Penicillium taxi TaxID=168475 RepID=UPI002544F2DD|nr:uncharacterized protein N7495_000601 [Penicillium taxi]KAJ5907919.1 hypothetical protein N7495_000601 [Penicillium taxi]
MKLFQIIPTLFLFRTAVAGPSHYNEPFDMYDDRKISSRDLAPAQIERRSDCLTIAHAIYTTTTMEVGLIYASATSSALKLVCKVAKNNDCVELFDTVSDGLNVVLGVSTATKGYGIVSAYLSGSVSTTWPDRRSLADDEYPSLDNALRAYGYHFDSITDETPTSSGAGRNTSEPGLVYQYMLNNFRKGDNVGRDYALLAFEDGTAQLHAPLNGFGNMNDTIQKRTSTLKGVKIAFQLGTGRILNSSYREGAAEAIANKWLTYAKKGYADTYGLVEKTATSVLYYRTISELDGWGTNYENVNACGALSEYLGEYIGEA